jgi:PAS domain S-box-containing protein
MYKLRSTSAQQFTRLKGSCGGPGAAAFAIPGNTRDAADAGRKNWKRQESEDSLNAIFGQTTTGIAKTELTGQFVLVNQRFCEIVGRSAEELYQLRMQDITHSDDRSGTLSQFKRMVTEGREFTIEKRYVRPDGSCVWAHNSASLIRDKERNPSYAVVFTTEISTHKQIERGRERLLDRERASRDESSDIDHRKDEFLAMLVRELRNPLSDILSAAQILEQLSCHDQVAKDLNGVIKRQSLHTTKLIDDLLDITRIETGRILLQVARLDLVQLVQSVIADHLQLLDENQLMLIFEPPSTPIWVVADATRLAQVVSKLLHNATKFTDPGGTIEVSVNRMHTFAMISVRDSGVGMGPTELAGLFEPFHQAESSRVRSQRGLGLGLAISKRLISKQGGVITATSEGPGRGSEFSIRLPLDQGVVPELVQPVGQGAATLTPRRVLIVDDDRDARLTLSLLLARMDQQIAEAENGEAALDVAKNFRPEIVLCDICMPDMDGYTVARAMRADPVLKSARLVALTGYGQPEDRDQALKAGFDRHLTKPINYDQLRELLL